MSRITEREKEILTMLSQGLTQQEIAYRTRQHVRTVEEVIAAIKIKLDAVNLFQLGMKYQSSVVSHKEIKAA